METMEDVVSISYSDFQKWILANRLSGAPLEDTRDFLQYLGYCFFHNVQKRYPLVTLDMLSACVFDGHEIEDLHKEALNSSKLN